MVRWLRRHEGQELVEYAIILPVLLMLLLGIAEFAVLVLAYDTVSNAAREGARYGAVHPADITGVTQTCVAPANRIVQTACALTSGLVPAQLSVTPSHGAGSTVRVEVSYQAPLIVGFIIDAGGGSPTLPLRAVATMRIE